jgi:hypothetical protein
LLAWHLSPPQATVKLMPLVSRLGTTRVAAPPLTTENVWYGWGSGLAWEPPWLAKIRHPSHPRTVTTIAVDPAGTVGEPDTVGVAEGVVEVCVGVGLGDGVAVGLGLLVG